MRSTGALFWMVTSLVAAAAATPSPLKAQDRDDWQDDCYRGSSWRERARYCDIREVRAAIPQGRLVVEGGQNGGAMVRGEDRSDLLIEARIETHAGTDREARELADQVRVRTDGGIVQAEGPLSRRGASWSVTFLVRAPRRTNVELRAENGPVSVREISGTVRARTENGPLSLERVSGDVRARTANGPLGVVLSGSSWEGVGLDAETQNGPVDLALPEGYSAQLETGTINGPMDVDVPLSATITRMRARRLTLTLGPGGPPVRVVSTNGPFTLRRP